MTDTRTRASFDAVLYRPAEPGPGTSWAFLVLPKDASEQLPRRGRVTVDGTINGVAFRQTLEPDGQLSHWLKVGAELREAACVECDDVVTVEMTPVERAPEPVLPEELEAALQASAEARTVWERTTALARLDWIHWITSAKQPKTRAKRISDACSKLASGERRVCCFDTSGFYSKAFAAPRPAD